MREQRDRFIKGISRFNIWKDKHIRFPINGRDNAFNITACLLTGRFHIQRAIDDDMAEFSGLRQLHNIYVIQ